MSKIAWIGLGAMGYPMAGHVRTKGAIPTPGEDR